MATEPISQQVVASFLRMIRGQEIHIDSIMKDLRIDPESRTHLRVILGRLGKEEKLVKPSGARDGWFKVLRDIKPIRWQDADESLYYDLVYPMGHGDDEDYSSFGLSNLVNLSPGDLIVISGVKNRGKSAIALNLLGENVDKHECVLMGNEYTTLDGRSSPKFKRRMTNMRWVNWFNGTGDSKFELLPVRADFEDHIQPGKLNIIDWINITDQFYKVGKILEDIKVAIGNGLAIVVLQKEEEAELGRGRGFTRDFADLYLTIDPLGDWESRMKIGYVKDPKAKAMGRMWGFKIVDGGANLSDIREIKRCTSCWGKGFTKAGRCDNCGGKGFVDKYREGEL